MEKLCRWTPEYWAIDNAYPCHSNGDPMTFGEPCGYAIFKQSTPGRNDVPEDQILAANEILSYYFVESIRWETKVKGTMSHARATTKCFMSPIHTVVTATGKILQCCFFEERPIGTIFEPFSEVWGNEKHLEVIEKTTVQECYKLDCRWNIYNSKMKEIIEDPLAQASFI